MRKLVSLALAAALVVGGVAHALAEGLDEISPDVVKRLYNKDMLDPAQPVGSSAWRDFSGSAARASRLCPCQGRRPIGGPADR